MRYASSRRSCVESNWVHRSTVAQLKGWLLRAFREHDYAPMDLLPSRDADGQIRARFDTWSVDDQEKFKMAVVVAVSEWRKAAHGCEVLDELLHLAALIRASDVVKPVRVLFRRVFDNIERTEEVLDLMDTAVGVVAGFAGVPAADALLEQWFFDDEFPYELLSLTLVGLCLSRPSEYPRYLPRFLQYARSHPDAFDVDFIMDAFVDTVTPSVLAHELPELETQALENLNAVMASIPDPPARIVFQSSGFELIDLRSSPPALHRVSLKKKADMERFYKALVNPNRSLYELLDVHIPIRNDRPLRRERRGDKRSWLGL